MSVRLETPAQKKARCVRKRTDNLKTLTKERREAAKSYKAQH